MGIGEELLRARKAKGITIEVAEEETKIRAKFLEALENEQFEVLPGRVYAKAFLRTYARYLGLDDAALAAQFDLLCPPEEENGSEPKKQHVWREKRLALSLGRYRAFFLVAAVVGLLVLFNQLYSALFANPGGRVAVREVEESHFRKQVPAAEQLAEKPVREGNDSLAGERSGTGSSDKQQGPSNGGALTQSQGVNLKLTVTRDRCWMRVITDGVLAFEGELWAGQERTFTAKNQIRLKLGNAGVVAVSYNGQELGYLGAVGQVVTRDFLAQEG